MDLYLPDEFYALSESPNPRRGPSRTTPDDAPWLGGEAFVAPLRECRSLSCDRRAAEPDPIWRVI